MDEGQSQELQEKLDGLWDRHGDSVQIAAYSTGLLLFIGTFIFIAFGVILFYFLLGGSSSVPGKRLDVPLESVAAPCAMFLFAAVILGYALLRAIAGRGMTVATDKRLYSPDEEITGTITINRSLKSPARSLSVSFFGLERSGKHQRRVFESKAQVSGARTFVKGETVRFSIRVPPEAKARIAEKPGISLSINGLPMFGSRILNWCVEAKLDLPGEVDMSKIAVVRFLPAQQAEQKPPVY